MTQSCFRNDYFLSKFIQLPNFNQKNLNLVVEILWGEQDSNLRRFPNGFTVRPRWPLEYLPKPKYFSVKMTKKRGESRIRTCEGFPTDLQSVLVGRLSISPKSYAFGITISLFRLQI